MTWHTIRKTIAILAVMTLLVGSASVAVADQGSAQERPWKVSFNLNYDQPGTHECDPGYTPSHAVGTLKATHMGLSDGELWDCVDFESGHIDDGVGVITAANGDECYMTYTGQITGMNPDGSLLYELTGSFEGGTGRFSNATGTADGAGLAIPMSATHGVLEGTLAGTITYNASDRSQ
jgi:hypothetical protein